MALGSWLWGLMAESYGLQLALGAAAILMLAGAALGLLIALPPRSTLNLDPLNQWREPHFELDVEPRSGPIHVEIAYTMKAENVPAFLIVMADRKRIRRRDGAQHWKLLHDLGEPERWVERYRTPTWTDYVRHNLRRTQADADVNERIRALHEGPERPAVRRFIERPPNWFTAVARPKSTIDPP